MISLGLPLIGHPIRAARVETDHNKTQVFASDRMRRLGHWLSQGIRHLIHAPESHTFQETIGFEGYPELFIVPGLGMVSVGKRIGAGGLGIVHEGEVLDTGETVAVKFARSAETRDFLRAEVAALMAIQPDTRGIVRVLAGGTTEDYDYSIMERVPGENLRTILSALRRNNETIPIPYALAITRSILYGLKAFHDRELNWADLKPENIMISHVRLAPTGAVEFLDQLDSEVTILDPVPTPFEHQTHAARGTPTYMSPEIAQGGSSSTSDIYSLGVILFELLTGQRPYEQSQYPTTIEMLYAHINAPLPYHTKVPGFLKPIIRAMMEKNPDHRYCASDLAGALEQAMFDWFKSRAEGVDLTVGRAPTSQALGPRFEDDEPVTGQVDLRATEQFTPVPSYLYDPARSIPTVQIRA